MKPVVWGVLSVSTHYRLRVHTYLAKSPLVEMRAVASRSREKAAAFARESGIPRAYGSYEELLADKEIEAVYIPLPNHMHAEWVKKCADAGKHVLCEKPFALDAHEAEDAIRHAEKRGVRVMEAFMYRFHPQWQRAREIVKAGELGSVHSVHTLFAFMLTDPSNIRNVLSMGGGGLPDIGCYAVSTARFIFGREPTRVVSLVHRDPKLKTDILSSGILDFGAARSVFTVGTQTFSWQKVDVIGSDGQMRIHLPYNAYPDMPMRLTVTTGVGERDILTTAADQYQLMFEGFSRAVRGEEQVPTPPQDAINNMKVLDALFRSETSGQWEKVG
ncbi:MAG: Gfo/Idh/MocA family oxidoreductase [Spirochaetia bacterium]